MISLTKRIIGILRQNGEETGEPYQYAVGGLQVGEGAMIARGRSGWQILRIRNSTPDRWEGDFATSDLALSALAKELENNEGHLRNE